MIINFPLSLAGPLSKYRTLENIIEMWAGFGVHQFTDISERSTLLYLPLPFIDDLHQHNDFLNRQSQWLRQDWPKWTASEGVLKRLLPPTLVSLGSVSQPSSSVLLFAFRSLLLLAWVHARRAHHNITPGTVERANTCRRYNKFSGIDWAFGR